MFRFVASETMRSHRGQRSQRPEKSKAAALGGGATGSGRDVLEETGDQQGGSEGRGHTRAPQALPLVSAVTPCTHMECSHHYLAGLVTYNTKLATPRGDVRVTHCTVAIGYHMAGKCKISFLFFFLLFLLLLLEGTCIKHLVSLLLFL